MTLNAKNDKYGCPVCEKIAREEGLMNDEDDTPYCPVEKTLSLIGGKYKALILWRLMEGPMRFSQLARIVTGATPRTLTRQLRELEEDHLVHRHVYAEVPVRVEYSLTPQGESIYPILASMYRWGSGYLKAHGQPPRVGKPKKRMRPRPRPPDPRCPGVSLLAEAMGYTLDT